MTEERRSKTRREADCPGCESTDEIKAFVEPMRITMQGLVTSIAIIKDRDKNKKWWYTTIVAILLSGAGILTAGFTSMSSQVSELSKSINELGFVIREWAVKATSTEATLKEHINSAEKETLRLSGNDEELKADVRLMKSHNTIQDRRLYELESNVKK